MGGDFEEQTKIVILTRNECIKLTEVEAISGCDNSKNQKMLETKNNADLIDKSIGKDMITSSNVVRMEGIEMTVETQIIGSSQQNKMKIALGILVRLVLPLCNGVARGWQGIRGVRLLKALGNLNVSRQMLTNMLAYAANTLSMGLSTVQVAYRIDPILKIIKLKKGAATKSIAVSSSEVNTMTVSPIISTKILLTEPTGPEKCVTLNILAEPPAGTPIKADIIFIHGLHGSLVNTWKQGLWRAKNLAGKKVKFQRPPRPPLRPPKRPRHWNSKSNSILSSNCGKRRKYGNDDSNFIIQHDSDAYESENAGSSRLHPFEYTQFDIMKHCEKMESSYPTFRLRVEDENINKTSTTEIETKKIDHQTIESIESILESKKYSPCWPGDWLPLDCPGVRVIAVNYTTDPYLWRPAWVRKRHRTNLRERAREMSELLIKNEVGNGHPIVWVGHSKGGIFIKQIIVDAWESGRSSLAPLWRFSKGVFFYSVPHRGSPLADFNLPFLRQSVELTEIQKGCPCILDLHRRFVALYDSGHLKIDVFSFVETALTLMSVLYLRIVGIDSADPGIGEVCGVHLDHREICKPRNRNCFLYTELVKMIHRILATEIYVNLRSLNNAKFLLSLTLANVLKL